MGIYRLALALMVALSHIGLQVDGYDIGVVAVISFYILSGYVMAMLIDKYYSTGARITAFYLDRAARLFPQYLFYVLATSVLIWFIGVDGDYVKSLDLGTWTLNLLMIPNAFYMYWGEWSLVAPQSWSLGLESTFYLVIPWILIYLRRRQILGLSIVSIAVFIAAYFDVIDTAYFGYRLLPGTLFMFLVGVSLRHDDRFARGFRAGVMAMAVVLLIGVYRNNERYALLYNKEVLVGLILGMVAVPLLRRFRFSRHDELFGNLSYGVFLNHFLVIWIMQRVFGMPLYRRTEVLLMLLVSVLMAGLSFVFVERPALAWRHRIRSAADREDASAFARPAHG